ncbi:MAG: InlB B-repeat-containing protein [Clostridia bacterium]|nr:InlB B-repeat-containing protein [Clostridia bacterium]
MKKAGKILSVIIAFLMILATIPIFASAAGASPAITSQETYCYNNTSFSQCYQGMRLKWNAVSGASYYSLYIYQFDDFYSSSYTRNTLAFSTTCYTNSFDSATIRSESTYLETYDIWGGGTFPGYYVLVVPRNSSGSSLSSSYTYTDLTSSIGIYDPHMLYFYTNDGTNTEFDKTSSMCHNGVTISEWSSLPTRKGYKLIGWSKNKNSSTAEYSINDKFSCGHGDAYFYAVWSPNKYTVNYNSNGGTGSMSSSSHTYDQNKALSTNKFTRSGYYFLGWSTNSNATSATYSDGQSVINLTSTDGATVNLYAIWSKIPTYTVSYNANGGAGAPSAQTKTKDTTLWLSSTNPTKSYTVTYNANGGSVSPSSKTVNCTFKNWNTAQNGSGTSYSSGASYTANSGATLYAQWTNPTYGTLPTPTRTGYTFDGWYTAASGGTKITSTSALSSNITIYAHWTQEKDIYNLGEETYSFSNYGDYDSPGGHCFGMSITSAAYYLTELDIALAGGNYEQDVYSLNSTSTVRAPICYYQDIQDSRRDKSMVAGGSFYKNRFNNISSDWAEVVNYVKNHNHDNKGTLQIGFRKDGEGGHAINFLYYAEVDGQARIYAYDNNYPNTETYFYMDSSGSVRQAPRSTFSGAIDCITLRSVPKFFDLLDNYDSTRYIFADKDTISIEGATVYALEGGVEMGERVMYEVPANATQVRIKPLVDNADFEYLNENYSFGKVDDDTVGIFTLATSAETGNIQSPGLEIESESKSIWDSIWDFFKMIIDFLLLPFSWLF